MFTRSLFLVLLAGPALAAGPNLGTPVTHGELAAWDIHILPDGTGLPKGSGTSAQGAAIYVQKCAHCHGEGGRGGARGGSIVDPHYLALVSDQHLRTTVITGRPDLGKPDWRTDVPGQPMTPQDIADVVTWLAAQRQRLTARASSTPQTTSARQAR